MPVRVSPLVNKHLVHITWLGGAGKLENSPHIGFAVAYEGQVLLPPAEEEGQVILSRSESCRCGDFRGFVRVGSMMNSW